MMISYRGCIIYCFWSGIEEDLRDDHVPLFATTGFRNVDFFARLSIEPVELS